MRIAPCLLAGLLLTNAGIANQTCTSATVPLTQTNWSYPLTVHKFDPALGTLEFISVSINVSQLCTVWVESSVNVPLVVTTHVETPVFLLRPDLSYIEGVAPYGDYTNNVSAYDGTLDYVGPSSFVLGGINGQALAGTSLTSTSDLALFTGQAGNPGTISLQAIATGTTTLQATGWIYGFLGGWHSNYNAGATLNVCYQYAPFGTPFCVGDGSGHNCPCANFGAPGEGCLNSTGFGAVLASTGTPSVAQDSLALTASQMPAGTLALLYQGTSGLGVGTLFGDGLRCVGGSTVRLGSQAAPNGSASWPQAGQSALSVLGSVVANSERSYQVWYRNSASFCTPATFNLSPGLSIVWSP